MHLLKNNKRFWLGSYIIVSILLGILYLFSWDNSIGKTVGIMIMGMQILIVVEFILVLLGWTNRCRSFFSLAFLVITIFATVNGYLNNLYIISPTFAILEIYMLWLIGGVKNCIIVSPYQKYLYLLVDEGKIEYKKYAKGIDDFNNVNNFNFFTKASKKWEPNWQYIVSQATRLQMFNFVDALFWIDMSDIKRSITSAKAIINDLKSRNNTLENDKGLHEEVEVSKIKWSKIASKNYSLGFDATNAENMQILLDNRRKKELSAIKKMMKRKIQR